MVVYLSLIDATPESLKWALVSACCPDEERPVRRLAGAGGTATGRDFLAVDIECHCAFIPILDGGQMMPLFRLGRIGIGADATATDVPVAIGTDPETIQCICIVSGSPAILRATLDEDSSPARADKTGVIVGPHHIGETLVLPIVQIHRIRHAYTSSTIRFEHLASDGIINDRWSIERCSVMAVSGCVDKIALKPPVGDEFSRDGAGQTKHKNNRNQINQFLTHNNPPLKSQTNFASATHQSTPCLRQASIILCFF